MQQLAIADSVHLEEYATEMTAVSLLLAHGKEYLIASMNLLTG